jgi:hypothetical protein
VFFAHRLKVGEASCKGGLPAAMADRIELCLGALCADNVDSTAEALAAQKSSMDESEFYETLGSRVVALALVPSSPLTLYVQFVLEMQTRLSEKPVKKALNVAVQAEYELLWNRDTFDYVLCDDESQQQPMVLPEHKAHWMAFMEFLGLLYVNGLVAEVVIRSVLEQFSELRGTPDDNLVEGICALLLTDGVVAKLFSTKRGESFLTQWKGMKCFSEFSKKKTRYLDIKATLEAVTSLVENRGKMSSKTKIKSPSHGAQELTPKSRFANLGEMDSPSHGPVDGKDSPYGDRKGKGSRGKSDKGGEKGGQEQADPKQVFVAGIGSASEDEIRSFFNQAGEVSRVKVLRTPEGDSKDVCFITFRNEEQAQRALNSHGSSFSGRTLTVRIANGKKGNDKGAGGKGDTLGAVRGLGDLRLPSPVTSYAEAPDIGSSTRFDALATSSLTDRFGDDGSGGNSAGKGKSKNTKGKGKGEWLSELDSILEEALLDSDGPVKVSDFDFNAKRFLSELRSRDRLDGTTRFEGAVEHVITYTAGKDRDSVRKWSAYVFTLLQKYDPDFSDEFKKRDAERRRERAAGQSHDDPGHEFHERL